MLISIIDWREKPGKGQLMQQHLPAKYRGKDHVRHIAADIIITILTCGLFNLWVQSKQMQATNDMIGRDKYNFFQWLLLSLLSCGLFHIYHEYRMSGDIEEVMKQAGKGSGDNNEALISLLLCVFGLSIVADAIQQSRINHFYGSDEL